MTGVAGRPLHRLMALALFVGLPAILLSLSGLNLLQMVENDSDAAGRSAQVAAFDRRLNKPAADGKAVDLSQIYLPGLSRTLASANLQQRVVSLIAATSGRLIETAAVDPVVTDTAENDELRLKATLDIDNTGLIDLLYRLETGLPLLTIENLSIRRMANDGGEGARTLRVDILVRGHWRQSSK